MSSETVKLQRGLLRELIFINFFPFGFVCIKSLSRGIYLHVCIDWTKNYKPIFWMSSTIILLWCGSPKGELQFPNCRNICHLYVAMNLNLSQHLLLLEVLECSFSNSLIPHKVINQLCALIWITWMPQNTSKHACFEISFRKNTVLEEVFINFRYHSNHSLQLTFSFTTHSLAEVNGKFFL